MPRECTEMERRVAAALAERAGLVPNDGAIARHLADARAAIRSMRVPDNKMLWAGYTHRYVVDNTLAHPDVVGWHERSALAQRWQAMINAASPPDSDA